jgi:hypothetical protein
MFRIEKNVLVILVCSAILCSFSSWVCAQTSKTSENDLMEEVQRRIVEYNSDDLKDPFQACSDKSVVAPVNLSETIENQTEQVAETAISAPSLVIQGIVWGSALPQAIVNNKIVKTGDVLEDGSTVTGIYKSGITVDNQGSIFNVSALDGSAILIESPDLKRRD